MATFPGDMSIGWGFGLERQEETGNSTFEEGEMKREAYKELDFPFSDESQPTDPLLAVSELEQRVSDLEERLRRLTIVVNSVVDDVEYLKRYERNVTNRIGSLEKDMKERFRSMSLDTDGLVKIAQVTLSIAKGLIKRTEILARNAGISFTDDLEEKD